MVGRPRRVFWWDVVRGRQWETARDGHELVLGPGVRMVIKTLPEWSEASLDLDAVSLNIRVKVVGLCLPAVGAPLVY